MTMTASDVVRRAGWFDHYSPGHWSLNLVNVFHDLPEPYRISRVKGGYTAMLAGEKVGTWKGKNLEAFEAAIVGCWTHMDALCGAALRRVA